LREPNVCRVDVSRLVSLNAAELTKSSQTIMACDECEPGAPKRRPGGPKPFCMNCGRDLVELPEVRDHIREIAETTLRGQVASHQVPMSPGVT
jgi:hypothetical protein